MISQHLNNRNQKPAWILQILYGIFHSFLVCLALKTKSEIRKIREKGPLEPHPKRTASDRCCSNIAVNNVTVMIVFNLRLSFLNIERFNLRLVCLNMEAVKSNSAQNRKTKKERRRRGKQKRQIKTFLLQSAHRSSRSTSY